MPTIGVLVAESAPHPFTEAFRAGLRGLGYVEQRTITIDWRYADALFSRAVALAAELVKREVDLIAAHHTPAVRAAMNVTRTIPIVMAPAGAPLQTGLVKDLARPEGNVTGLVGHGGGARQQAAGVATRRDPRLSRVAILGARSDPFTRPYVDDFQNAAVRVGLTLQPILVDGPVEFDAAFRTMATSGTQAVVIQPLFQSHTRPIIELAARHRIAIMSSYRDTTEAGGLLSYSADHAAYFQRAAIFVDKILKGAKPSALPVEQPTQFEFVVNLKTAKALGLTIPPALLARADHLLQ
jgi:putative ABC transport system substrate-binding protein